jgi:uncharacterized membrane protein
MKRINQSKNLSAALLTGGSIVAASALADPSQGSDGMGSEMSSGMGSGMMDGYGGGWMGGYGGIWVLILLVIVVAGLVAWVVKQKRK